MTRGTGHNELIEHLILSKKNDLFYLIWLGKTNCNSWSLCNNSVRPRSTGRWNFCQGCIKRWCKVNPSTYLHKIEKHKYAHYVRMGVLVTDGKILKLKIMIWDLTTWFPVMLSPSLRKREGFRIFGLGRCKKVWNMKFRD